MEYFKVFNPYETGFVQTIHAKLFNISVPDLTAISFIIKCHVEYNNTEATGSYLCPGGDMMR